MLHVVRLIVPKHVKRTATDDDCLNVVESPPTYSVIGPRSLISWAPEI